MIQRVQTIWLSLVIACIFLQNCIFFRSVSLLCAIENGLIILISVFSIFLYKKRKLQVKLCYGILVLLLISAFLFFINFWIGFSLFFDCLAIRSIYKDEKLVRSIDRLRE